MFFKKNLNITLFCVNLIITILVSGYLYYEISREDEQKIYQEPIIISESNHDFTNDFINVEIKGAVVNPGVYKLENNRIINDVISLAGGFKKDAYTNNINLSMHLKDEMLIYVYTKGEYKQIETSKVVEESPSVIMQKEIINTCLANGDSIIVTGEDITVVNSNDLVNINSAAKDELTSLNGIGDAKANAIIEYRTINGQFNSIEDLLNVPGISQSLYDKIKAYITV